MHITNTTNPSAQAAIALAASVPAGAVMGHPDPYFAGKGNPDPHVAWEADLSRNKDRIVVTPTHTAAGLAVQVRMLKRRAATFDAGNEPQSIDVLLMLNISDTATRLLGGAA